MTVNNTTTYLNNTGPVSFRSIQSHFANGNSNAVKMGDYTRSTDKNLTPSQITANNGGCVPDATENSDVNTSKSDMKMSDYHGSIREYRLWMTGCEDEWKIESESWNSNLTKNVFCHMTVRGTAWSNDVNTNQQSGGNNAGGALTVNDGVNIELDIAQQAKGFFGSHGPGGTGGDYSNSTAPTDGTRGGDALYLQCNGNRSTNEVTVRIHQFGCIWGGGGGGGGGDYGDDGPLINCWVDHWEPFRANAAAAVGGDVNDAAHGSSYFRNVYSNINQSQTAVPDGNWRNRASDNPSRACANNDGACPNNWIWDERPSNLGGSGWVNSLQSPANGALAGSGLDTNVTPATGGALNNCREWGYNNDYKNPNDQSGSTSQRSRCRGRGERGASYGNASSCTKEWVRRCYYKYVYELGRGQGADGGNGGHGSGATSCNSANIAVDGNHGDGATQLTCNANSPANSSTGDNGERGGHGGNYGQAGDTGGHGSANAGAGGAAGYAIYRNSGGASWNLTGAGVNNNILGPTGAR